MDFVADESLAQEIIALVNKIPFKLEKAILLDVVDKKSFEKFHDSHKNFCPDDMSDNTESRQARILKTVAQLTIDYCHILFCELFQDLSTDKAKILAKSNVNVKLATPTLNSSLVYGDVDFFSLADILNRMEIKDGEHFVDLGHGTGRALVCAALLFGESLSRISGIEILPELFHPSETVIRNFRERIDSSQDIFAGHKFSIEIELGDFLVDGKIDWVTADVVFVNSTCFDDVLMTSLAARADVMKAGSRIVTLTKPLPSQAFVIRETRRYAMSWGAATCYLQFRL